MAKGKTQDKSGGLDRSPSHLLHRAVQAALDIHAQEFERGALTQRQYAVLAAAAEHEGATQADLVRITGVDRSTLADLAKRLLAKGLLERQRSASDARANAVRLTEAGHTTLEAARIKMATVDARVLKLLSGGRRRAAFVDLLSDLVSGGDSAARKAARKADGVAPEKKKKKKKAARIAAETQA